MASTLPELPSILSRLQTGCEPAGLDLVVPLRLSWYNARVAPRHALPDGGRPGALGLLVANTAALWPPFVAALRAEPALLADPHPVERYVVRALERAVAAAGLDGAGAEAIRWSHDLRAGRLFSAQQAAVAAGLAHLAPCYLCIHPVCGPWFAVRAVVILADHQGPATQPVAPPICETCAGRPCLPLLELALAAAAGAASGAAPAQIQPTWRRWLAVRDACPVGRARRYSEAQARYHYTKDRAVLEAAAQEPDR